jgi:DNA-directed RNA polymerase beta' subunit
MELGEIADVKRQIITPRLSTPIIGVVQDGLLGAYNLTSPNMSIDWRDAMNIISYTTIDDFSAFKKDKDFKGIDLFSVIIPGRINVSKGDIEIEKGVIKKGRIAKNMIGANKENSLIHLIWDEYGVEETKNFIDNTQRLINNFNLLNGFTVGIGDIVIPPELENQINKLLETKKLEIKHLITEMENNHDLLSHELFEESIYNETNTVLGDVSKLIMNNFSPDNNFNIMISSGSKGSPPNMGQMGACIGQVAVEGKRIKKNIAGRALPYFHQNDDSALARGFVEQPFLTGVNPTGFIFHHMGSREGLIDTAIKSVTGDTPIIISKNNIAKRVLIGDWIDELLNYNKNKVKHYEERDMELLELTDTIHIPTTDEDGNVSWGKIKNITRHDPGNELYKIKTLGGRDVIVTESKSLLIWDEISKKLIRTDTPNVQIGNYVPVTMYLPKLHTKNSKLEESNLESLVTCSTKQQIIDHLKDYYIKNGRQIDLGFQLAMDSNEQLDKINMLLSRLSIFGGINKTENTIIIKDYWAKLFRRHILCQKVDKLLETQSKYKKYNDIVLDKIIVIEKVDIKKYPKVYDLTIPSTLNFGLANGLHVVDTAESGYVQRRLVKFMEDVMVKYDLTVRNANNTILQFVYGDSGIDTTKQYGHTFKLISMGNKEVDDKFKFDNNQLKSFPNFVDKKNQNYVKAIRRMRDDIRQSILKISVNQITLNTKFMLPVNFNRIINNIKSEGSSSSGGKLDPDYILNKIDSVTKYENTMLMCMNKTDGADLNSIKNKDEQVSKTIFKFALHAYLAPKVCIYEHKFNKAQFDKICDLIIKSFNKNVISIGEMTGITAAQSIGEPTTQLTLNSIDWKDKIFINENNKLSSIEIGKYIDKKIKLSNNVKHIGDDKNNEMGDTYYLDTIDDNISTLSINKNGEISWNKIDALTKHLPMNMDGTNDLIKITTDTGKSITATKAKSFLTIIDNEIKPIRGDKLALGILVPVMVNMPKNNSITDHDLKNKKWKYSHKKSTNATYEKIINIETVKPSNRYVYDLTVQNDKTFVTESGICCYDTFHSAGIGGAGATTLGVPRIKEILNFSKNMKTPSMMIYLEDELRNNKDIAEKIASYIKYTTIEDIRDKIEIYFDPNPFDNSFTDKDNATNIFYSHNPSKYGCQSDITTLPWLMRIILNKEKMMDKELVLLDIKTKFCNFWEKRFIDTRGIRRENKQLLEKIGQCAILSNNDNDITPILHIRFDMKDFNFGTITGFLDNFIEKFKLKGISDVNKINSVTHERVISFDNDDQSVQTDNQYVIYTAGINMTAIRYINGVNINKTTCNDIIVVYNKFGIEAARAVLLKEIEQVFNAQPINYQHISILVDVMTNSGSLISIDRHSLARLETDPLSRASFEKTVDQFLAAAVFGEVDTMKSVSSRIMAGLAIKGGTGLCDVILDTNLLENSEYIEDIEHKYHKTFTEITVSSVMIDILRKKRATIFMPKI